MRLLGAAAATLAVLTIACDKSPAAPGGRPNGPPAPAPATPLKLEITGPDSVPPGASGQFKAVVTMSDGTTRDVTMEASWRSNSVAMTIVGPGVVTGPRTGSAMLTAVSSGFTSTREVIFVPEGTYRLTGVVNDPAPPSGPIYNADIRVVAGTGQGLTGVTGENGQFSLYGVAGQIELRISKFEYQTRTEQVLVAEHSTRNLELARIKDVQDVSGSYTLTISAAETCSASLPADAMVRTYSAKISQVGPALTVKVTGANFAKIYGGWPQDTIRQGRVDSSRVLLEFGSLGCYGYYYGCGPSILEQLDATRFFLPSGLARLQITPDALSGEIDGNIEIHEGKEVPGVVRTALCQSTRHRITFTR